MFHVAHSYNLEKIHHEDLPMCSQKLCKGKASINTLNASCKLTQTLNSLYFLAYTQLINNLIKIRRKSDISKL